MAMKCLSCGKPLGGSSGLCYSCEQEGIAIEDVVEVDDEVRERMERYLVLSAIRCPDCGDLHRSITVDGETHSASSLDIDSVEAWELEIDEASAWLEVHADDVREALPILAAEWPGSVRPIEDEIL